MSEIILGSASQIKTINAARSLWAILQDDPRFGFQGRTVLLADEQLGAPELVISLSRLQGYAGCHFVAKQNAQVFCDAYKAAGLNPVIWHQYWGRETALTKSRAFLRDYAPPKDLAIKAVTPDTPRETVLNICEMSLQAGVLPASETVMRGIGTKGVFLYVESSDGRIVASGGACMAYHAQSPRADEAFWGMLATHEDWRGKRLAGWIGAQVIQDMAKKYGAAGFSSGVKPDNPSSQAICARLGVGPSDYVYAGATDPAAYGDGSITR